MAGKFYSNSAGSFDGSMSGFNEASFKMLRLHELQKNLNDVKQNPFAYNYEIGSFNFQISFRVLNQYLQEIVSRLSSEEIIVVTTIRDLIKKFMELKIAEFKKNKKSVFIDAERWKFLEPHMESYETLLRTLADRHGFATAEADDPNMAMLQ